MKRGGRAESLLRGLEAIGADRLLRPYLGGRGAIFVLHRAAAAGTYVLDPDTTVSADLLDGALRLALTEGYECVRLDDLPSRLRSSRHQRFAAFTFDDGYRDNLTVALPVFRAHRVPFCLYVATGMIDRTLDYWWGALARLVTLRSRIDLDGIGFRETVSAGSWPEKQAAFSRLQAWVHEDLESRSTAVLSWCRELGIDPKAVLDEDALSWNELRELSRDPLVTIGAHTVSHQRLSRLDDSGVRRELDEGRARIEREVGCSVRHFAYPYGGSAACGAREFHLAAAAGYLTAVTTRRGNLFAAHSSHLTSLPRRRLSQGEPELRTAWRGLAGTEWLLRREPRLVVTS
jgi:peptidoglycan/xylan/chitin deacetylase (PgdA/CDA1 family)